MISTEWVHTVATGIPVYAAAGLVLWGQGYVWRRTLWEEHGGALRRLEDALGGRLVPTWTGWRIHGTRGEFRVTGGVAGVRARWQVGGAAGRAEGMPSVDEVVGARPP